MNNRVTVSLSLLVDLKLNDGVDISSIKEVMNGLDCNCLDTVGKARVMRVDILERNFILEEDDEPDAEYNGSTESRDGFNTLKKQILVNIAGTGRRRHATKRQ